MYGFIFGISEYLWWTMIIFIELSDVALQVDVRMVLD